MPKTFSTPSAWSMRARTSPPLVSVMMSPRVARSGGPDVFSATIRPPRRGKRGRGDPSRLPRFSTMDIARRCSKACCTGSRCSARCWRAGAVGGLIAGLLGVGGGIVIVPALDAALDLAGVSPAASLHVAVATSMATIIPTSISSSRVAREPRRRRLRHREALVGADRRRCARRCAGCVAGGCDACSPPSSAVVAAAVALKMLLPLDRPRAAPHDSRRTGRRRDPGGHRCGCRDDGHRRRRAERADHDAVRRADAQGRRHRSAARALDQRARDRGLPACTGCRMPPRCR